MIVTPIAGALGAEVSGLDLAHPLPSGDLRRLRAAWLEHLVLFFRDQPLDPAQFSAFARQFGEPVEYPFLTGLPDFPFITQVIKRETEQVNFGGLWHTDTTYQAEPPMATLLIARELPPKGGDTMFANMYLAYEGLSHGLQRLLGGLTAVHTSAKADASKTREDLQRDFGKSAPQELTAEHPVVRTHPESGRKLLFLDRAHVVRFRDMTEAESAPLLNFLFEHQARPEFTCRFQWRPGSIALWDNRCTHHNPINDYHGYRRVMHRITLAGDKPR